MDSGPDAGGAGARNRAGQAETCITATLGTVAQGDKHTRLQLLYDVPGWDWGD